MDLLVLLIDYFALLMARHHGVVVQGAVVFAVVEAKNKLFVVVLQNVL